MANRAYLQRGGGHYVVAEKLRNASGEAKEALSCPAAITPPLATSK